jgi:hypothetical protein
VQFRELANSWCLASILSMASAAPTSADFDRCDTILHGHLHLLKGVHLDLAHALARHAVLVGEFIERDRLVGKAPRLKDGRSRSFRTVSASPSAMRRLSASSLSASCASWLAPSSTSQSCHPPELLSSRIGELSDKSPPSRPFMSTTSCSVTPCRSAMSCTWSGRRPLSSRANMRLLALRR